MALAGLKSEREHGLHTYTSPSCPPLAPAYFRMMAMLPCCVSHAMSAGNGVRVPHSAAGATHCARIGRPRPPARGRGTQHALAPRAERPSAAQPAKRAREPRRCGSSIPNSPIEHPFKNGQIIWFGLTHTTHTLTSGRPQYTVRANQPAHPKSSLHEPGAVLVAASHRPSCSAAAHSS